MHEGAGAGGVLSARRTPSGIAGTGGADDTRARSGTDDLVTTTRSSGIQSNGRDIVIGEGPGPKVFALWAMLLPEIDWAGEWWGAGRPFLMRVAGVTGPGERGSCSMGDSGVRSYSGTPGSGTMDDPGDLRRRETFDVEADLVTPETPEKTVEGAPKAEPVAVKAEPGWWKADAVGLNSAMLSRWPGGHGVEEMRASAGSYWERCESESECAMSPESASSVVPPREGGAEGRRIRRGGGLGPFERRDRPGLGGPVVSAASLAFHSRSARRATLRVWRCGEPGDARRGETGPIVGERGTNARLTGRVGVNGPCSLTVVLVGVATRVSSVPNAVCAERRVDLIGRVSPGEWPTDAARPSELL